MPSTGTKENVPQCIRRCNIRTEKTGTFVDLAGGGGAEPPVIAFQNNTWETNPNQIWEIMSVPNSQAVVIKSTANHRYLHANGHDQAIRCETTDWRDQSAQWTVEGGDPRHVNNDTVVRFRNVKHSSCVLDEAGGNGHGTTFISYNSHGGPNQAFKLWGR
ncbi:Ricin B lectin domain containing protein [Naviculisporaceae sp. PSN 640]